MIPINQMNLRLVAKDLDTIRASNTTMSNLAEGQRAAFLKQHESECSDLRTDLWQVGSYKCWYSEARINEPEGHVEHYRPKRRLSGASHAGYWWRALDWTNLRLAHSTVNRRKTDYLTGELAGKGSYFPLRHENRRAATQADEIYEEPILLDPIVASDTRLIAFSEDSGRPVALYKQEDDAWRNKRAEDSIAYYHLHEASWNAKRADLMAAVRTLCEALEKLKAATPFDQDAYDKKLDEIVAYIRHDSEFSSACTQVVRGRGIPI